MKTEKEIKQNLRDIEISEKEISLSKYMIGYRNALRWVLG